MQTHQDGLDGENEPTESEKIRASFERGASKKGYSFTKDDLGRYEDVWLQEAWEIFNLIDIKKI